MTFDLSRPGETGYQPGFANHFASEALPGALPAAGAAARQPLRHRQPRFAQSQHEHPFAFQRHDIRPSM